MTRLLILVALALAGLQLAWLAELAGRLAEVVGRLRVLTAEHGGGYDSETFAQVPPAARERLETARAGLESARWN